jgi:hypothetical protein
VPPRGERAIERVGNPAPYYGVADERPVTPDEAPAREALLGGERVEESSGVDVVQRKDRESLAAGGDTRREPAEASGRVVQEHGPRERHRRAALCPVWSPSSAACTSAPTVSST